MRRRLEGAVRRWWDGEATGARWGLLSLLLLPVEWLFRAGVAVRGWNYDHRSGSVVRGPIPVVSVGNLSVGGTGKTPVAAWLISRLSRRGLRPALVLRGYGEDEILLHRRWNPGAVVVADSDRLGALRRAHEAGAGVAVLDDGFQHRRLHRDLDLVLVSAEEGLPGRLLPRGPFREPAGALLRADGVIVTQKAGSASGPEDLVDRIRGLLPGRPVVRVRLVPDGWRNLDGSAARPPEGPLLAACSIARPETFRTMLGEMGAHPVDLAVFPDHHEYAQRDVEALLRRLYAIRERSEGKGTLVVTEKDAVKLARYADELPDARALALRVETGDEQELAELLSALDGVKGTT